MVTYIWKLWSHFNTKQKENVTKLLLTRSRWWLLVPKSYKLFNSSNFIVDKITVAQWAVIFDIRRLNPVIGNFCFQCCQKTADRKEGVTCTEVPIEETFGSNILPLNSSNGLKYRKEAVHCASEQNIISPQNKTWNLIWTIPKQMCYFRYPFLL